MKRRREKKEEKKRGIRGGDVVIKKSETLYEKHMH